MSDQLYALTTLDGRHAGVTAPLTPYASEAGLIRARVRVEVEYLLALADLEATPLDLDESERRSLRDLFESFGPDDAALVKRIETEGYDGIEATGHDVKAVEYFVRDRLPPSLSRVGPWVHFGLTSEDVNNLAHRLLVRDAIEEVLLPELRGIRDELARFAGEWGDAPMLARTHGQPATPTTFGKEMAVFGSRLTRSIDGIREAVDGLTGKLSGATGTYAAHDAAYTDVDWLGFARSFVGAFGFEFVPLTTQINPCDDLAALCDAIRRTNDVLLDLNVDAWLYVGNRLLAQRAVEGEVGSSTMPHKCNPVDFEIGEGNLSKANADLQFVSGYVTRSRLQRDLSDSTAKRTIGPALAHSLIGYVRTRQGLAAVSPDTERMREELAANPAVLGEAFQTVLRREGDDEAYERLKALTRGDRPTVDDLHAFVATLDLDESTAAELRTLTPATYTGLADRLADAFE